MRELMNGIWLLIVLLSVIYAHEGRTAETPILNDTTEPAVAAVVYAADSFRIPRAILLAVCYHESHLKNFGVTHKDGHSLSYGICQIKLATARFMDAKYHAGSHATPEKLNTLKYNAIYAAAFLKYQYKRYHNWALAIDAYNKNRAIHGHTKYVMCVLSDIGKFSLLQDRIDEIEGGESETTHLQRVKEQVLLN